MLEIVFTAEDFYIDTASELTEAQSKWVNMLKEDKFKTLYELGFDVSLKKEDKTLSKRQPCKAYNHTAIQCICLFSIFFIFQGGEGMKELSRNSCPQSVCPLLIVNLIKMR